MTTDHDELVADRLRTAADRAAGRVRPAGAAAITDRARARVRRRRAVAGLVCAGVVAALIAAWPTSSSPGPAVPVTPADSPGTAGPPAPGPSPSRSLLPTPTPTPTVPGRPG
ncbi:hypothetical protein [Streptomyces sp. NPDC058953]|uniref:hypothetical protein n=1 Tax=unclassified Streptomyces TaxID=2593676 RepID=UPI00367BA9FF